MGTGIPSFFSFCLWFSIKNPVNVTMKLSRSPQVLSLGLSHCFGFLQVFHSVHVNVNEGFAPHSELRRGCAAGSATPYPFPGRFLSLLQQLWKLQGSAQIHRCRTGKLFQRGVEDDQSVYKGRSPTYQSS